MRLSEDMRTLGRIYYCSAPCAVATARERQGGVESRGGGGDEVGSDMARCYRCASMVSKSQAIPTLLDGICPVWHCDDGCERTRYGD